VFTRPAEASEQSMRPRRGSGDALGGV